MFSPTLVLVDGRKNIGALSRDFRLFLYIKRNHGKVEHANVKYLDVANPQLIDLAWFEQTDK